MYRVHLSERLRVCPTAVFLVRLGIGAPRLPGQFIFFVLSRMSSMVEVVAAFLGLLSASIFLAHALEAYSAS